MTKSSIFYSLNVAKLSAKKMYEIKLYTIFQKLYILNRLKSKAVYFANFYRRARIVSKSIFKAFFNSILIFETSRTNKSAGLIFSASAILIIISNEVS